MVRALSDVRFDWLVEKMIVWSVYLEDLFGSRSQQDALGSVTGLHYDSKYFRIAKENGELCMVSRSLNITMICLRFS